MFPKYSLAQRPKSLFCILQVRCPVLSLRRCSPAVRLFLCVPNLPRSVRPKPTGNRPIGTREKQVQRLVEGQPGIAIIYLTFQSWVQPPLTQSVPLLDQKIMRKRQQNFQLLRPAYFLTDFLAKIIFRKIDFTQNFNELQK